MAENKDYITLKEAAKISGYAPDYIGQLIRSGKLPGKQVFLNVAWMTTREAIEQYAQKENRKTGASYPFDQGKPLLSVESLSNLYSKITWVAIGILGFVILILFGILAITFDKKIERGYIEKLEQQKLEQA